MRRVPCSLLGAILVASLAHGAPAIAGPAPFEEIRTIERLQDQIAMGDSVAQAAHAKAMLRAADDFAKADHAVWRDKRNARALILYLFSGGVASVVARGVPDTAVPTDYTVLYRGALAYGLGDDETARATLVAIDPKTLPSGLGGHLALVQATLIANQDAPKAIATLDLARLLEPGTLVEEAALRKEMSLIGATGNLDKFAALARRYVSGFSKSVYEENFRRLISQTAIQIGSEDSADAAADLTRLLSSLDRNERRKLYLSIAREAAIEGRTMMASLAAKEAGGLVDHGGADEARALTYFGAAAIVGPDYDDGLKALSLVKPETLKKDDRELRASALVIAEMIRHPIKVDETSKSPVDAQTAILADGERSLAAASKLLAEANL